MNDHLPADRASTDHQALVDRLPTDDHRVLGRDLGLFTTDPLVGPGLPLWLPGGAAIRAELERLAAEIWEHDGCRRVNTPVLAKRALFERSGHWGKFAEDMFPVMRVGGEELVLRPANCPHHAVLFAARPRSHRELPVRFAELGSMFRSELSGVLAGLSRVRQINLDDTHVFCRPDQAVDEVVLALESVLRGYRVLGLEIDHVRLSRRDWAPAARSRFLGDDAGWRRAEQQLSEALARLGLDAVDGPGEAAFYGPKIDVQVRDARGREETLSTVQFDLVQPERFDLAYVGPDGARHRPVMIHRGVLSAMERMVAHLLERYGAALPMWLAPRQVVVLPVAGRHVAAADGLVARLRADGVRAETVAAEASLGRRVRQAWVDGVPCVAVIGDRELADDTVGVRLRDGRRSDAGRPALRVGEFVAIAGRQVRDRRADLDLPLSSSS
jgi:threonyl-tRNA synthetase